MQVFTDYFCNFIKGSKLKLINHSAAAVLEVFLIIQKINDHGYKTKFSDSIIQ
jgi:hypothetical protein